jgi:hypothetical protein
MFRRGSHLPNAPAANVNKLSRMLPIRPKSQQEHSPGRYHQLIKNKQNTEKRIT